MPTRRFGLVANGAKRGARELVAAFWEEFSRQNLEVVLEARTAAILGLSSKTSTHALGKLCDLVIVLGGDGTLLQVVRELGADLPPIFGVNLGSLGFLTAIASKSWGDAVALLAAGDFGLSPRTLLSVEVVRGGVTVLLETALNEAVISRGELSRLIKIDVLIDGVSLTEYNADGLIVATPTGSTAYSLSAGGPVLMPDCGVFVITPICPHVLTLRPMIVGDGSQIEIVPTGGQTNIFLTVDGQNAIHIQPGDRIRVTKAAQVLQLAMLPGSTFFQVLRQKLKWSGTAV